MTILNRDTLKSEILEILLGFLSSGATIQDIYQKMRHNSDIPDIEEMLEILNELVQANQITFDSDKQYPFISRFLIPTL